MTSGTVFGIIGYSFMMYDIRGIQLKTTRHNYLPKITNADKYVGAAFVALTVATVFLISLRILVRI